MKQFIIILSVILIASCSKNAVPETGTYYDHNSDLSSTNVLSEFASVLGNAGSSSLFQMANFIQENDDIFETVYMESISGTQTKASDQLADAIIKEIESYSDLYPNISKLMSLTKSQESNGLEELPVELYLPNNDVFDLNNEEYITVGYQQADTEDWTYGYKYSKTGDKEYVALIDESYLNENPTILVLPKDSTIYSRPIKVDGSIKFPDRDTEKILPDGLVRENIKDSKIIREQDVLYTTIASLKADGKSWCGAISNKLKLAIYRASGDVVRESDGSLNSYGGTCHKVLLIAIPKSNLENGGTWLDNSYVFDDNWNLHEYEQKLYFVSEHNTTKGTAAFIANIGVGLKDGKVTGDLGCSVEVNIDFGKHSHMRTNNGLERKAILANNVSNLGSGQRNGFAIRRYGIVDIVFNFYYTRID